VNLSLEAQAKLNLGLRITGVREDGFHNIISVFQEITLSDTLTVEAERGSGNIELSCSDARLPAGPANIAWQAARLFLDETGDSLDVVIHIEKRIPSMAGLGGGSSDGAAVIKALASMTGRCASDFHAAAESLGSDVPFFLHGGAALIRGRGEIIEGIPVIPFHAVLIHPEVQVSTPWAYELWDGNANPYLTNSFPIRHYSASSAVWHEGKPFPHDLRNDFLPLLEKHIPEIEKVADFLDKSSCPDWGLSGSGPTFFALFENRDRACVFSENLPWEYSLCRTADTAGASSNG
jgi:4-diphosphocytidyl-2-C-methyl-D-erythritol kinase